MAIGRCSCRNKRTRRPAAAGPICSTFARALAEAGQFEQAVAVAEQAIRMAEENGRKNLTAQLGNRRDLYRQNRPFRAP